jgi:hypothetical protein
MLSALTPHAHVSSVVFCCISFDSFSRTTMDTTTYNLSNDQNKTLTTAKNIWLDLPAANRPNLMLIMKVSREGRPTWGTAVRKAMFTFLTQQGWQTTNTTTSQFYFRHMDFAAAGVTENVYLKLVQGQIEHFVNNTLRPRRGCGGPGATFGLNVFLARPLEMAMIGAFLQEEGVLVTEDEEDKVMATLGLPLEFIHLDVPAGAQLEAEINYTPPSLEEVLSPEVSSTLSEVSKTALKKEMKSVSSRHSSLAGPLPIAPGVLKLEAQPAQSSSAAAGAGLPPSGAAAVAKDTVTALPKQTDSTK